MATIRQVGKPFFPRRLKCHIHIISLSTIAAAPPGANAMATAATMVPTWSELSARLVPSAQAPLCIDFTSTKGAEGGDDDYDDNARLYRERNGWCVYSARLWLALEVKGVLYDTVLLEARGDTYDGSTSGDDDGRPARLRDLSLPQLRLPGSQELCCCATEESSLEVLRELDGAFPETTPLWPPLDSNGCPACTAQDVSAMANQFGVAVSSFEARESSRAAWLFRREEGYRLDPLPRRTFEFFLDTAERLLARHPSGPFFCGSALSAADVVWAPLLERYAAQLPCLHAGLRPRGNRTRWPNLSRWYDAMHRVPPYACRVKGDAPSWRKVLYVDPWWPSADQWHPRETVGPKGELLLSEDECCEAFGTSAIPEKVWAEYAASRPFVATDGPHAEAGVALVRNRRAILKDAARWIGEEGYTVCSSEDLDLALRGIISLLGGSDANLDSSKRRVILDLVGVAALATYLDNRVCVPRDMGAPSAAAVRSLAREIESAQRHHVLK